MDRAAEFQGWGMDPQCFEATFNYLVRTPQKTPTLTVAVTSNITVNLWKRNNVSQYLLVINQKQNHRGFQASGERCVPPRLSVLMSVLLSEEGGILPERWIFSLTPPSRRNIYENVVVDFGWEALTVVSMKTTIFWYMKPCTYNERMRYSLSFRF
jgi:hypothetical protein